SNTAITTSARPKSASRRKSPGCARHSSMSRRPRASYAPVSTFASVVGRLRQGPGSDARKHRRRAFLVERGGLRVSAWGRRADGGVNCRAMPYELAMRCDEPLERSLDLVEINVGNESIDAGVDARRLRPMQITVCRDQVRQHLQIRKPARVGFGRSVSADALVKVALRIEFLRLAQPGLCQGRMLP